tara:strand:+ start:134 stop:292 length:159 start_codon:yes stop_codon:yes gene_type:complete
MAWGSLVTTQTQIPNTPAPSSAAPGPGLSSFLAMTLAALTPLSGAFFFIGGE